MRCRKTASLACGVSRGYRRSRYAPRRGHTFKTLQDAELVRSARSPVTPGQTRVFLTAGAMATAAAALCACGGGADTVSATSDNAVPQITSLAPDNVNAEGAAFILTVNGSQFASGSSVLWNDAVLPTTYVSAAQLTAQVPSADLASAGPVSIKVRNAAGGTT